MVLPLVPVTATLNMSRIGSLCNQAEMTPAFARGFETTSTGKSVTKAAPTSSVNTAMAPFSLALPA